MIVFTIVSALLLAIYVLVNALDLGAGMLLLVVMRGRDRDAVLGGAGKPWMTCASSVAAVLALILAGLPESLGPLRALWPVLLILLAALVTRAAAATVRRYVLRQDLADLAFGLASLLAVLCQGAALGWILGALGTDLPARHAGALGWISVWGLLGAASLVGLYALFGSSWLIWAGRDAVGVLGREVARAAVLLFGAAALLCVPWAFITGVEAHVFAQNWERGAVAAVLAAAALGLLVPFQASLWNARSAVPAAWGMLSGASALAAAYAAVFLFAPVGEVGRGTFESYLAVLLLLGGPALVADVLQRRRALRPSEEAAEADGGRPSHAGRRSGSLANSLHLS